MSESSETSTPGVGKKERLKPRDIAYVSGMLDSDGYISGSHKGHSPNLMIAISNSSPKLHVWLKAKFGGSLRKREPKGITKRVWYEWHLTSKDDRLLFLKRVLRFVRIKRRQVILAMAYLHAEKVGKSTKVKARLINKIQAANQRRYSPISAVMLSTRK